MISYPRALKMIDALIHAREIVLDGCSVMEDPILSQDLKEKFWTATEDLEAACQILALADSMGEGE